MTTSMVSSGRPQRADARRNYEALVATARQLFGERGSDVSMEDIARCAGVGIGTLYRHFPRRIDIVEAVFATDIDELAATAESCSANPDAGAALTVWLTAFVRYAEVKRAFLTELHEAFEKNSALRSQARECLDAAAGLVLRRAQEAGVVRSDLTAADLMRLVGGMCMSASATPESNGLLLSVVLDGIRRPAADPQDSRSAPVRALSGR